MQDKLALLGREVAEGDVRANPRVPSDVRHEAPHEASPGLHCPLVNAQALVWHERGLVDHARHARPAAGRAGTRRIEGQLLGPAPIELLAADGAHDGLLECHVHGGRAAVPVWAGVQANAREEQPQTVQELGRGAKGRAHAGHTRSLPQCEGGGHVLDQVDVGAGGLREAAARVGRERLEVAAAALGIEHAQSQARLAGAGDPGDAHKLAKWHGYVNVLEVVHACAADLDGARSGVAARHAWVLSLASAPYGTAGPHTTLPAASSRTHCV